MSVHCHVVMIKVIVRHEKACKVVSENLGLSQGLSEFCVQNISNGGSSWIADSGGIASGSAGASS